MRSLGFSLPLVFSTARCARRPGRSQGRPRLAPATWVAMICSVMIWALSIAPGVAAAAPDDPPVAADGSDEVVRQMLLLLSREQRAATLELVREHWRGEYTPMLLELVQVSRDRAFNRRLMRLLREQTGRDLPDDTDPWYEWLWREPPRLHPLYADFKAHLFGLVDPRFRGYFAGGRPARIRLDEVRWGGVRQDGIPPLRQPKMIAAAEASYLDDGDLVFGLVIGDDARAWPRRILGWHEMVVDTVGTIPVTGVYCTLCNAMIVYESEAGGTVHEFGTSGFLYRSNKLMYDRATQSLWSSMWGRPVIGPLAETDLELRPRPVVTTTWGEWRRRHPATRVLALDTGYERDYREGMAYREYFASDEPMFAVPALDDRLDAKAEILGIAAGTETVAWSRRFLLRHPLHHEQVGELRLVVLTDPSGGHRVYETGGAIFVSWDGDRRLVDGDGLSWSLTEDALRSPDGRTAPRHIAHRAYWFGWAAAYPQGRLVGAAASPVRMR